MNSLPDHTTVGPSRAVGALVTEIDLQMPLRTLSIFPLRSGTKFELTPPQTKKLMLSHPIRRRAGVKEH
jgi:hypothetical protein